MELDGWTGKTYVENRFDGYWASATCPEGKVITGFRTQVEPDQGYGDDTALNGVQFQCDTTGF